MEFKRKAIILAGGKGTRLWPLSREGYPKQFVEFIEGKSLFQHSLQRLIGLFNPEDIYIITNRSYEFHVVNQIKNIPSFPSKEKKKLINNIIIEPVGRNTAPAVLLTIKYIEQKEKGDCITFVFPSDHIISPQNRFNKALRQMERLALADYIVVMGIKPLSPCPGYGYIVPLAKIGNYGKKVNLFVEKPSSAKAAKLLKKGAYWNAGIFCFAKSNFISELTKYSPDIASFYNYSWAEFYAKFASIREDSIDYAVMQKTQNSAMVEFNGNWTDLGSWESVFDYFAQGKHNVSIGKAEFFHSQGCFAYSQDHFVSFLGVKDIILVQDTDSILVLKKGQSNKVKDLINLLKKKKINQFQEGFTVYRPWGYYTILKYKDKYKVKEIGIYPKRYISLQKHRYRSEHWNIVEGVAKIRVGKEEKQIKKNQSIYVPCGVKHRVYNPGRKILKIIEVQIGNYLGEDDITRYDNYAR